MPKLLLVYPPRIPIRGSFLTDIVKILRLLDFETIVLVGQGCAPANSPKNVSYFEVPLSRLLNRPISNVLESTWIFLSEQILVAMSLLRLRKKFDRVIFSIYLMPLPLLLTRILRKKSLIYIAGILLPMSAKSGLSRRLIPIVEDFCYRWAEAILIVASHLVTRSPLSKYSKKAFEAPIRLLDEEFLSRFSYSNLSDRRNVVGFVGRLSWEKGIVEYMRAIPRIIQQESDVSFLIVGDGPLRNLVLEEIESSLMKDRVSFVPWTDKVEVYLKRIKLLVLPSKSEGIPSVMLEAMACGTVVLATAVGGLQGLLEEGRNAFLLNNTETEYLAHRVTEVLERPDLEEVANNAYRWLVGRYNERSVITAWKIPFEAFSRK